jgi:uncharacterized protein YbaA (DUF1428 family)
MSYIQGFVVPVPIGNKQKYRDACEKVAVIFKEYGAKRIVEAWGVDVPDGTTTDFKRAVKATPEETVVFSWIVWPDRATCDAASAKMRDDERMKPMGDMPFDMKRLIYGGFEPIFETGRE